MLFIRSTTIKINSELLALAQGYTNTKSKKQVAEDALRLLIKLNQQTEIKALKGKLNWTGELNDLRES